MFCQLWKSFISRKSHCILLSCPLIWNSSSIFLCLSLHWHVKNKLVRYFVEWHLNLSLMFPSSSHYALSAGISHTWGCVHGISSYWEAQHVNCANTPDTMFTKSWHRFCLSCLGLSLVFKRRRRKLKRRARRDQRQGSIKLTKQEQEGGEW